jgi:CBS domain-containing protein
MRVGDLMTTDVPIVAPQETVLEVASKMIDARVKALPVCSGGSLAGIITDWDVTRAVATGGAADEQPVTDYMTAEVVSVGPDASLSEAGQLMSDHRIHHLVVCDGERFVGIVHLDVEWADLGVLGTPHATFAAPI